MKGGGVLGSGSKFAGASARFQVETRFA